MLILTNAGTDKLDLVSSSTSALDVHASWQDLLSGAVTPGRTNTAIVTATTTDIVATPGGSTYRNVKTINIRNKGAASNDVTVRFNQNGTAFELHKATLGAGEALEYVEGVGFFVMTAVQVAAYLTSIESATSQRTFMSQLERAAVGTFVTITGTAYYIYVGRTSKAITVQFVEAMLTTNGAGAQTAEMGLFSTPSAPGKSAQTLTKLVATGTVDSLTAGAVKVFRNTSTFNQAVPANTHLWAAFRTAMATTQPTCGGLAGDFSGGAILTTTGGGALTGLSTASGTIPAAATATVAPDLRAMLD